MQRIIEYSIFFIVLLLLQVFLFDNLNLSTFLSPLIYAAFIVMLPVNINSGVLLALGLVTGIVTDLITGAGGVHTIASLAAAFARPGILVLVAGKDITRENAPAVPGFLGTKKWVKYSSALVVLHCIVFFMFEAMTFRNIGYTLLRILSSGAATLLIVWFIGAVYPLGRYGRGSKTR